MGTRYTKTRTLGNDSEYYEPLRKSRKAKKIIHYETPVLYHPTPAQRRSVRSTGHIWKYGDRLYKLSHIGGRLHGTMDTPLRHTYILAPLFLFP